jgi:hypothetical protein
MQHIRDSGFARFDFAPNLGQMMEGFIPFFGAFSLKDGSQFMARLRQLAKNRIQFLQVGLHEVGDPLGRDFEDADIAQGFALQAFEKPGRRDNDVVDGDRKDASALLLKKLVHGGNRGEYVGRGASQFKVRFPINDYIHVFASPSGG